MEWMAAADDRRLWARIDHGSPPYRAQRDTGLLEEKSRSWTTGRTQRLRLKALPRDTAKGQLRMAVRTV